MKHLLIVLFILPLVSSGQDSKPEKQNSFIKPILVLEGGIVYNILNRKDNSSYSQYYGNSKINGIGIIAGISARGRKEIALQCGIDYYTFKSEKKLEILNENTSFSFVAFHPGIDVIHKLKGGISLNGGIQYNYLLNIGNKLDNYSSIGPYVGIGYHSMMLSFSYNFGLSNMELKENSLGGSTTITERSIIATLKIIPKLFK